VNDSGFTPNDQCFSLILEKTSYIQLDDNDVRFVLDQLVGFS